MDLPWASGTDLDELRRQQRQPRRVRRLPADEARLRDQLAAALDACNDG